MIHKMLYIEDFKGKNDRIKELKRKYPLWSSFPLEEIISLHNINNKIGNSFGEGKRVAIISYSVKNLANKYIKENNHDSDFDIGESFLVRECIDVGPNRPYQLKLNGIILQEDRFGFEKMFSSSWFCPESSKRLVLQAMGFKFDNQGNMIK